ncbi:sialate O-acetylesterase [Thalassobellus suaedae]|uniref:Sialate O-acetylesterase n=1 Tax=Thalassobellus suaedae TaxID=3074124 RepID=A0ABY9XUP0_9FLAO|nr:sialate O-acetylesterase [Flavobacteriaceae bacterium HL-DH14]
MNEKSIRIIVSIIVLASFLFVNEYIHAAVPNSLFSNHMVIQQKIKIPIWGHGSNGELVTIKFNGQQAQTTVENNCWEIVLNAMDAGGPYAMKIIGDTVITLSDIYIGEVWVCSGQSNMERKMSPHWKYKTITNYEKEKEAANHPLIRQYEVPEIRSDTLIEDAEGKWIVCSPSTVESFSAVAYFFARDLHNDLKVPIGILLSTIGGTQAKHWTSRSGLESNSHLLPLVQAYDSALKFYPIKLVEYNAQKENLFAQYKKDSSHARKKKRPLPRKPMPPQDPTTHRRISCYYNGMIAPLTKYPIKGALWYQGESDVDFALQYQILFPTLISDWRKNWNIGNFPFLYVQIAPFKKNIPELREAQLLTLQKTMNTAMVVTVDCGDENDIHPPYKQPIGYRLSLAARALAYNKNIAYSNFSI